MDSVLTMLVMACITSCIAPDTIPEQPERIGAITTSQEHPDFPCDIRVEIEGDKFIVSATVENRTTKTVTFVNHPDHRSISILAADRSKDESVNPKLVSYRRATADNLINVAPGSSTTFVEWFRIRRPSPGVLEVGKLFSPEDEFMRIRDKNLRATFSYGWYPDYLPIDVPPSTRNYIRHRIVAKTAFDAPK